MEEFNKNEKQRNFAEIKGIITELNEGEKFCSITLEVGHENKRSVNLVAKKVYYPTLTAGCQRGDKVCIKYYLTSHLKNGRWTTMATALNVIKEVVPA